MKKRILIVDDEKHILRMLSQAFEGEGYEIDCAGDGKAALERIRKHSADVVITDVIMPKMGGIDLFYKIRKIDPFTQIILITGYPFIKNIIEMFEAGASDFIIKPFDIEKLKKVVEETFLRLNRWRSMRKIWRNSRKKK
ncbi:MAG: response regulator [Elusimicrobia bacterium]|nr:response regulator [Elusimicrobiota bacterium]